MDVTRTYEDERGLWDAARCIHTAICLQRQPEVFDVHARPWVNLSDTDAEAVAATIRSCPTVALRYDGAGIAPEPPDQPTTVEIRPNGPLYLRGRIQLRAPGRIDRPEEYRVARCPRPHDSLARGHTMTVERMTPSGTDGAYAPAVAETHSGLVFFAGDRAFKLKKAVALGFLDFTSRQQRLAGCTREVELNRRLAPDVYLGVADVLDAEGAPCDHLVVMRRMPAERRLSTLVLDGAPVESVLDDLASLVAAFHAKVARSHEADRAAGPDALAARWAANTAGLEPFGGRFVDGTDVQTVDRLAARFLAGRSPLFAERIAAGRACDGHGDLLADDIFCPARPS